MIKKNDNMSKSIKSVTFDGNEVVSNKEKHYLTNLTKSDLIYT